MENNKFINILAELKTLQNLNKSNLSQDDLFLLESFLLIIRKQNKIDNNGLGELYGYDIILKKIIKDINNQEITDVYNSSIYEITNRIKPLFFRKLIDVYNKLEDSFINKNTSNLFESILNNYLKSKGKISGIDILPLEVTRLIKNLIELPEDAKIYNPFAGLASFGVEFNGNYLGQELVKKNAIWGQLRLIAHSKKNAKIIQGDSTENWNPNDEKYDLIVANPPFGLRNIVDDVNQKISVENFFITNGLNSIKENGKIIGTISLDFLNSLKKSDKQLREHLVDNDLIDMIITLPNALLNHTNSQFAIIIISNNKKNKNNVTFVNATSFIENSIDKQNKVLDYKALLNSIKIQENTNNQNVVNETSATYNIKNSFSEKISNEDIKKSSYDLNTLRYFLKLDSSSVYLNTVLKELPKKRINKVNGEEKLIRISDLKNDALDYILDLNQLEPIVSKVTNIGYKLTESCLLISKVGHNLKPTYFEYEKDAEYYINHNIIAFNVDISSIDIAYLISELHSKKVKEQVLALSKGTSMPYIHLKDIKSIKIQIPNLKEQKEKVNRLKEVFIDAKKRELELQKEILGIKDDSFKEFASIKHTFRQYLNDLKSNVIGTRKFILKNNDQNINLDMVYSKNLNISFKNHLLSLESTIDSMAKVLTDFEFINDESESEILDFEIVIREAQNRTKKPELFSFSKTFIDIDLLNHEPGLNIFAIPPHIRFNKEDFYNIFSNIVSNAINHGFKENKKYSIRTSLKPDYINKYWVFEIENNGISIPDDFTEDHLKTRGEKTTNSIGNGIGGNDIYKLLKKHQATYSLITDNDSEFKVKYQILIPFIAPEITL